MAVHIVKKSTLSPKLLKKFRHDEKLLYLCGAKPEERCRSGRSGRSRKPLYPYGYPGFESLSFRKKAAPAGCFFLHGKGGMRTLEGSLSRSALRSRDSLSFRKKAALKAAFFAQERRDENPGRVRYRAALWERSGQRLPVFPQKSSPCRLLFLVQAESSVHLILVNRRRLHPLVGSRLVATATLRNIFEHQAFICNIPPAVATGRDPTSG